ncbi:hypothetical protein PJN95_29955, partial [Mycobacterium kansasii]
SEQELLNHVPQQWVGILALLLFCISIVTNLIEKYPAIAKVFPLGRWWHARAKRKRTRTDLIAEDNEVIGNLQGQVAELAASMRALQEDTR